MRRSKGALVAIVPLLLAVVPLPAAAQTQVAAGRDVRIVAGRDVRLGAWVAQPQATRKGEVFQCVVERPLAGAGRDADRLVLSVGGGAGWGIAVIRKAWDLEPEREQTATVLVDGKATVAVDAFAVDHNRFSVQPGDVAGMIAALRRGRTLAIRSPSARIDETALPLDGIGAAIDWLDECGRQFRLFGAVPLDATGRGGATSELAVPLPPPPPPLAPAPGAADPAPAVAAEGRPLPTIGAPASPATARAVPVPPMPPAEAPPLAKADRLPVTAGRARLPDAAVASERPLATGAGRAAPASPPPATAPVIVAPLAAPARASALGATAPSPAAAAIERAAPTGPVSADGPVPAPRGASAVPRAKPGRAGATSTPAVVSPTPAEAAKGPVAPSPVPTTTAVRVVRGAAPAPVGGSAVPAR